MSGTTKAGLDEAAIAAIDTAAGYCRTLWATFIGYAATLFVLTSGTTHEALLRETPVKLPLFNVESGIPLTLLYVVTPLLLVLFHLNLLLKLHDLRVRVRALTQPLAGDGEDIRALRGRLRQRFTAFDYALLESGLLERRESIFLRTVVNVTIFLMPVLLLLVVQLQFLPYHDVTITWLHRVLLLADLALIGLIHFWLGRDPSEGRTSLVRGPLALLFALPALVSVFVLVFPGEAQDLFWRGAWRLSQSGPYSPLAGADDAERFGIKRSLYLADRALWAEQPSEELLQALNDDVTIIVLRENVQDAPAELLRQVQRIRNAALSLRGRNLSYANFENSTLIAADLSPDLNNEQMRVLESESAEQADQGRQPAAVRRTRLAGASLSGADLRGAKLSYAEAPGVEFSRANLKSAVLRGGNFQGSDFIFTLMQGANLFASDVTNTFFGGARLEGAELGFARLQGANLDGVDLKRQSLVGVQLQNAVLNEAQLQGARMTGANLEGAWMRGAKLQGADLRNAVLNRASLYQASLRGAVLTGANLQGADLSFTDLKGADFSDAMLETAKLVGADLSGADFSDAMLKQVFLANAKLSFANFSDAGIAAAEEAEKAPGINPDFPSGEDVWGIGANAFGGRVTAFDGDFETYLVLWATFVADTGCNAAADDAANDAIVTRLSERAIALGSVKGLALAEALLKNDCAKARVPSASRAELEATADGRPPAMAPD